MTDETFAYDPDTRSVEGMLLPFGEHTVPEHAHPALYTADSIEVPADPAVVTLNRKHNRFDPIGRATLLEKREAGIYSRFRIANTPEGDAWLAENVDEHGKLRADAKLRRLSAEVAGIVRNGAKVIRSKLTGAALVTQGAFETAALYAIDTAETHHDTFTDAEGVTWQRVEKTDRHTDDDGTTTTTSTVTESTTDGDPDPAPADPTEPTTQEEHSMTLSPTGEAPTTPARSLDGLYSAIARNDDSLAPYAGDQELFALKTLQDSGPSGATIGADTAQVGYLGELWSKAPYRRRIIPLLNVQTLTSYKATGWRWVTPPEVGDYTGNVAEVPSNALDTESVEVTASRLAGGHRLDRRFRDFGDQAVIGSYLEHQTDDYKRKTDKKALAAVVAAATALDVTALDKPGTTADDIAPGLVAIVDAALQVITTENTPSYGLVASDLWRQIMLKPKDATLEYLRAAFGLEDGEVANFRLQPAEVGAGKVIVGAREALTYWELPGEAPIRVDGLVPGNGAEDVAVFGYYASLANNAAAIVSVDTATYGTAA